MKKTRNTQGSGSFKDNPNGTVTYRLQVGRKDNGNRKILTVTSTSRAMCIKEMKLKEEKWKKKQMKTRGETTVGELCQMHLQYQVSLNELKPKSIDRRESSIRNINSHSLGYLPAKEIEAVDIEEHISELIEEDKLSASSVEKVVDVLNAAYNWGTARNIVDRNPLSQIKPSLEKRIQRLRAKTADDADVRVLSEEEQTRLVDAALMTDAKTGKLTYTAGYYCLVLLYTGMRCGELLALRWGDVDLVNGYLTIEKSSSMAKNRTKSDPSESTYIMIDGTTKNTKSRRIKLTDEALKILTIMRKYYGIRDEEEPVVKTRSGRRNTTTNLAHRVETIYRNAQIPDASGLHILRATFSTLMYNRGARIKDIAAYIGDLESTTEKYYIAVRKKVKDGDKTMQVVMVPRFFDKEITE